MRNSVLKIMVPCFVLKDGCTMEGEAGVGQDFFRERNVVIANLGAVYLVAVSGVAFGIWVKNAKAVFYLTINEHILTRPQPKMWSDRRGVDLLNSTIEISGPRKIKKDE